MTEKTSRLTVVVRCKQIDGRDVARDVTICVRRGETLALVGPSGCGKTSLMRILAGLDEDFDGERICPPTARLSMAFQEPRLLPWRSVRENVALALPAAERRGPKADAALTAAGLEPDCWGRFPGQLSLGMARRAALARALVVEPDFLLLDEPFVSLDEATASRQRALIAGLLDGGDSESRPAPGVVLVTHDLREAAALADRAMILSARPATIVAEHRIDTPRAARTPEMIERLRRDKLSTSLFLNENSL